jgi:hypothetical protein
MAKLPTLQPMSRLPKEPSPDMLRTFGPRPSIQSVSAAAGGPAIDSPSPSAYRDKNPYQPPPSEYKSPSLLREHRRLAILFAGVAAAFAVYCLKAPHPAPLTGAAAAPAAPRASAPVPSRPTSAASQHSSPAAVTSPQPIYIEPVPDKASH